MADLVTQVSEESILKELSEAIETFFGLEDGRKRLGYERNSLSYYLDSRSASMIERSLYEFLNSLLFADHGYEVEDYADSEPLFYLSKRPGGQSALEFTFFSGGGAKPIRLRQVNLDRPSWDEFLYLPITLSMIEKPEKVGLIPNFKRIDRTSLSRVKKILLDQYSELDDGERFSEDWPLIERLILAWQGYEGEAFLAIGESLPDGFSIIASSIPSRLFDGFSYFHGVRIFPATDLVL